MTYRVRNIAIAGALAAAAVLFTALYVRDVRSDAERGSSLVSVLVAARDIVAGTPGSDAVEDDLLKTREVPRRSVVPGAISNAGQVEGLVASEQIYAGEQVTVRRFAPVAQQGVLGKLSGNMRGLQVPGNQHQLLAGTLKEGDRVDVVASIKVDSEKELHVTRIVLRDIEVLKAAGSASAESKLSQGTGISVLLAVTDTQVQKLFHVLKHGEWSLQLRPPLKAADSPESVAWVGSLLTDGLHGRQLLQLQPQVEGTP
jgi:Flp pilus assembly protein CpaB